MKITTSLSAKKVRIVPDEASELFITVYANSEIRSALAKVFKFKIPDCEFMPKYNEFDAEGNRKWDGYKRMFDYNTGRIYRGLMSVVLDYLDDHQIEYEVHQDLMDQVWLPDEYLDKYISEMAFPEGVRPHDYQIECFKYAVREHRAVFESATGSGKSMMVYMIARYIPEPTLIIVPRKQLRKQFFKDMSEYDPNWDLESEVQVIENTTDNVVTKRIVVATWQSIYELPSEWFNQFTQILGDEVHEFTAKSLVGIMKKAWNVPMRFGFTGTLKDGKIHQMELEGLFGPTRVISTTSDLQERGILADLNIVCLLLKYSQRDIWDFPYRTKYQDEMKYIASHEARNSFIIDLLLDQGGNHLLLFNWVDNHLEIFKELLEDAINKRGLKGKRPIFVVHGKIDIDVREEARRIIEKEDNAILLASYGSFQIGVNIKRLHAIHFVSPSKDKIRVMQSIGRVLRIASDKMESTLYDYVDDISDKNWINYAYRHYEDRLKHYINAKQRFKEFKVQLP